MSIVLDVHHIVTNIILHYVRNFDTIRNTHAHYAHPLFSEKYFIQIDFFMPNVCQRLNPLRTMLFSVPQEPGGGVDSNPPPLRLSNLCHQLTCSLIYLFYFCTSNLLYCHFRKKTNYRIDYVMPLSYLFKLLCLDICISYYFLICHWILR